jgi:hypothetical protein
MFAGNRIRVAAVGLAALPASKARADRYILYHELSGGAG